MKLKKQKKFCFVNFFYFEKLFLKKSKKIKYVVVDSIANPLS